MDKKRFDEEIREIDVPSEELLQAIDLGLNRGRQKKRMGRHIGIKTVGKVSAAAASAFLASGLIFAPVSNVLAAVPGIGVLYENFGLQIGYQLSQSDLITSTNHAAVSNRVSVLVNNVYYDGNVIGVTFYTQGDSLSVDSQGRAGPEAGYSFHIKDGEEQNQWSSTSAQLKVNEDGHGYDGAIEFSIPAKEMAENLTLPLTFTQIGNVKGSWRFDIPVERIPTQTVQLQGESALEELGYSVRLVSMEKGAVTALLTFETVMPLEGEDDAIELMIMREDGTKTIGDTTLLSSTQVGDTIVKEIQSAVTVTEALDSDTWTIQPRLNRYEEDTAESLDQAVPFEIESGRFDYAINVLDVKKTGDRLVIDYKIDGINRDVLREDIVQGFADFVMLLKNEDIRRQANGELDMQEVIEQFIRSEKVEAVDKSKNHYRSIFVLEQETEWDYRDYALTVPFGTLSINETIQMEPFTAKVGE